MKAVIVVWEIRIDHNSINNNKPTHTDTLLSPFYGVCAHACVEGRLVMSLRRM